MAGELYSNVVGNVVCYLVYELDAYVYTLCNDHDGKLYNNYFRHRTNWPDIVEGTHPGGMWREPAHPCDNWVRRRIGDLVVRGGETMMNGRSKASALPKECNSSDNAAWEQCKSGARGPLSPNW